MKIIKQSFLAALSLFAFVQLAAALPAPGDEVQSTIEKVKQAVRAQGNKESPALDQKLKGILLPVFDFEAMAKSSLGANWRTATPEEQKEFVSLFTDLLSRTYLKRIKSGVTDSEIKVEKADVDGSKAVVKTTISADGDPIKVDYRLEAENDKWRVYDVMIENIGLITNYREEFSGIVRDGGMTALIQKLKDKKADMGAKKS